MYVTTQQDLRTDLSWWSQMRVDGGSVVLVSLGDKTDNPTHTLVIADFPGNPKEAERLFTDLNEGLREGETKFSVDRWVKAASE